MIGSQTGDLTYYKCRGPKNSRSQPLDPDHRKVCVREDALLSAVANTIAQRVFGPDRRKHLHAQQAAQPRQLAEQHARTIDATIKALGDINAQQASLGAELARTDPNDTAWRATIRATFNGLEAKRADLAATLAHLRATQPTIDNGDPILLDAMPTAAFDLTSIPAHLQRRLFEAFNVEIRLRDKQRADVTITLNGDSPNALSSIGAAVPSPSTVADPSTMRPDLRIDSENPTTENLGVALGAQIGYVGVQD